MRIKFLQRFFPKKPDGADTNKVPIRNRDWNSMPSVTMLQVTEWVCGERIVNAAIQSSTDLLCVGYGEASGEMNMKRQIELSYEFNDDERLVMMMLEFNHSLLLRRTFLVQHADKLIPADGFNDFTARLNQVGRAGGYHSRIIRSSGS